MGTKDILRLAFSSCPSNKLRLKRRRCWTVLSRDKRTNGNNHQIMESIFVIKGRFIVSVPLSGKDGRVEWVCPECANGRGFSSQMAVITMGDKLVITISLCLA